MEIVSWLRPAVGDVFLHKIQGEFSLHGRVSRGVHVDLHHVLGQGDVPSLVMFIFDDEDCVKPEL